MSDKSRELFDQQRAIRKTLAQEQQVPPYVVFSDATLRDMIGKQPANEDEFLDVSGVGPQKLEHYGALFLKAINDLVVENGRDL